MMREVDMIDPPVIYDHAQRTTDMADWSPTHRRRLLSLLAVILLIVGVARDPRAGVAAQGAVQTRAADATDAIQGMLPDGSNCRAVKPATWNGTLVATLENTGAGFGRACRRRSSGDPRRRATGVSGCGRGVVPPDAGQVLRRLSQ